MGEARVCCPGPPCAAELFLVSFERDWVSGRVRLAVVVVVVVMAVVVMVAMIFVIPVAFVHLPSLPVVVVVGMGPIGAGVRWPLPDAGDPDVAVAVHSPIAIDPDEAR
jgi:hypothetical protein